MLCYQQKFKEGVVHMQDTAQRLQTRQTAATSDDEADNAHTHTRFLCEGSEEVRPQPEA